MVPGTVQQYDAIIIGGGHNGLVCAYYLAKGGMNCCVLERAEKVGGAAITEEFFPGFRNSVAAYTVSLLQPKVIKDMSLERFGLRIKLRQIDNFLPTDDGYLLAGRGGLTEREIARHSQKDALAYPRYQTALQNVVACIKQFLLVAPPNTGGGLADLMALIRAGRIVTQLDSKTQSDLLDFFTCSASEILDRYFENETVKALFAFDATVGHFASPRQPGTAYVLLHHVFGEAAGVAGAWGHAVGGMGAITQAMREACEASGVTICTQAPVRGIEMTAGRASGVQLEDGHLQAKIIASSVHPRILFEKLLPKDVLSEEFSERINRYHSHSATFRMNVALDALPQFRNAPLNQMEGEDYLTSGIIIAPSLDYMHQAWVSADQNGISERPIIEMLIPSTLDDSLAPAGKHVASLFCQHFAYQLPGEQQWDSVREQVADMVIQTVDKQAPGFARSVLGRQVLTPLDLERKFALVGGDIFHGRMSLNQLFSARPVLGYGAYRSPVKGLYMCGSGTHPGGGVTGAPGHNAAQKILRDQRRWSF